MNHPENFWWDPIALAAGEGRRWRLGTLQLTVLRSASEWHTAHSPVPEEDVVPDDFTVTPISGLGEEGDSVERFASDPKASEVRLLPRVAERSVVASPRVPLHVLPNHEAKFYVSSPVWIEVSIGPPWVVLRSIPARRLSDTWFGPSTIEGEVAFALKTLARVHLEELPKQVHRVITPVVVKNHSDGMLSIERLNLPVPCLSIYHTAAGDLWTEAAVLEQEANADMASLDVVPGAPPEAGDASLLSDPRSKPEHNLLVRAFSTILSTLDLDD